MLKCLPHPAESRNAIPASAFLNRSARRCVAANSGLGQQLPSTQARLGCLLGILPVLPQKRECLGVEPPRVVRLPFQDRVGLLLDLSVPVQLPV